MLIMLGKKFNRLHSEIFFLAFPRIKIFIQSVSLGYEEKRTKQDFLHINPLIKYSVTAENSF